MPRGSFVAHHGPLPSQLWEGISQDEHPPGETFDESSLRHTKPYVRTRDSSTSMALERLPPTRVAVRGDKILRGTVTGRVHGGGAGAEGRLNASRKRMPK
jgi:hypothetical protein